MPQTLTPEQARDRNVAAMGMVIGELYSELWQELARLEGLIADYDSLFGKNRERVDLLNGVAPAFFANLEDVLWKTCLLRLARLTDPAKSRVGKNLRTNVSVIALPELVDSSLREEVGQLARKAVDLSAFARDWRNRYIAHNDLALATRADFVTPLIPASRLQLKQAADSLAEILNCVASFYLDTHLVFRLPGFAPGGAENLCEILELGLEERKRRQASIRAGAGL